ncbi:MAG TPA: AAA family ATPase, partial [Roseiflexaceae bacterium]|nr:AAA family ATPase [Roseiflexaceae bacterium]
MLSRPLSAYLAQDRRAALARGVQLPDRTRGAALFADISGFTRLTAALVNELGPQRGADELSRELNLIYGALIAEVDRYGGSVIGFAGDAITCWFDDASFAFAVGSAQLVPADKHHAPRTTHHAAAHPAAACALAMQAAMRQFATVTTPGGSAVSLAIKVALASGEARRFQVGDPQVQLLDVLAGATLQRLAAADHAARSGEVLADEVTAAALHGQATVAEWRADEESGQRFAVLAGLQGAAGAAAGEAVTLPPSAFRFPPSAFRPWLVPAVYSRVYAGQEQLLAELRPVAVLFLSFGGIDYDEDPAAGEKLDAFICWAQRTIARFSGTLLQLTIGDKGSYFYCAFGAPAAHEDDAARAVMAAAQLRAPPPELDFIGDIRIGLSLGRTYSGAYGGPTRCTYGVLGNEVNLAARLMQAAAPGEIIASEPAARVAGDAFAWEPLPPLAVKGRLRPIAAARLLGVRPRSPVLAQLLFAGLPLVGRSAEIARIEAQMERALAGDGQVVAITGEAGMGKSRVVNECVRRAVGRGLQVFAGECQSYGTSDSYLAWQPIWQAFFHVDREAPPEAQLAALERELAAINPRWLPRLPLLGPALNLRIPDNDLTASLDPRLRKLSLEDLLVSCLRARAQAGPLMLVLEDAHWMDPLSHDLLEAIGLAIADVPVLALVAYRPPELTHLQVPRITELPNCTVIPLAELDEAEALELAELKQVHLGTREPLPPDVLARIVERTQGNPFYLEELLTYLHDRGFAPRSAQELDGLDLPASLSTLILSRIDQLGEHERATLKVASIIGRSFRAAWLWGFYPSLGDPPAVKADLELLTRLDLTLPELPEPAMSYLFKHILTHGVAYESIPYETRAWLHERLGAFIEESYASSLDQFVDLLAHHYDRSDNLAKRREYLRRAADQARAEYANPSAIDYYRRLLPLLPEDEQGAVRFHLGQVLELVGQWDEAAEHYDHALRAARAGGDRRAEVACLRATGRLYRK